MQRRFYLPLLSTIVLTAVGCQSEDTITSYTVPKPESVETPITEPKSAPVRTPPVRPPAPSSDLKYETPEGWKPAAGNQFSLAALEVVDGDERIETTVSAVGGDLLTNMNRWRGQVGLPDFTEQEMTAAFEPAEINGKSAQYIEMHAPAGAAKADSILGYVIVDGERSWFIKLRGSTPLAKREKENLQAFAKSLQW